jgi:hypothetical protein
MTAVNHDTEVPADSRREVLMGYQYALHQRKKEAKGGKRHVHKKPRLR